VAELRVTRARLLRGGAALAAGGAALAAWPLPTSSAPSAKQDQEILRFALLLEDLQAAFYADALQRGTLTGELLDFATVVGSNERAHADHVRKVLGAGAPTPPRFDFGDNNADRGRFIKSAVALEDLGVDAYNGAAPSLTSDTLADVARIVSVEARRAGWIRDIAGEVPAPVAEDIGISAQDARAAVNKTGFLR
jgi:Ferritin-like domain